MCSLLQGTLIGLNESTGLVGESKGKGLKSAKLNTLAEDDGRGDLVEGSCQLLVANHLANDSRYLSGVKLEHSAEGFNGEGIVEGGVGEEVGSETLLLNLLGEHSLDLLSIRHEVPDLDAVDEVDGLLPLTSGQGLGSLHHVVSSVLRGASEDLSLMVLEHTSVGLADDSLPHVRRRPSLCQRWNLKEQTAGQVHTLQELKVDVHVEGQLSLLLKALLLGRDLVVSLHHNTLGQQLFLTAAAADFLKSVLRIVNETLSEGAEANLDQGSVEQNLTQNIEVGDRLLKM